MTIKKLIHQLYPEEMSRVTADRNGWWEKHKGILAISIDDDDDDDDAGSHLAKDESETNLSRTAASRTYIPN